MAAIFQTPAGLSIRGAALHSSAGTPRVARAARHDQQFLARSIESWARDPQVRFQMLVHQFRVRAVAVSNAQYLEQTRHSQVARREAPPVVDVLHTGPYSSFRGSEQALKPPVPPVDNFTVDEHGEAFFTAQFRHGGLTQRRASTE